MVDSVVKPEQLSNDASTVKYLVLATNLTWMQQLELPLVSQKHPSGRVSPEPISIQDIRSTGPAPTEADLHLTWS